MSSACGRQSGFTLIEVLVALSVLALIGVAVAAVSAQQLEHTQQLQIEFEAQSQIGSQLAVLGSGRDVSDTLQAEDPDSRIEEGVLRLTLSVTEPKQLTLELLSGAR